MSAELHARCKTLISELGLGSPDDIVEVRPLTGGVASDIAMVDLGSRKICIKFALPKLKVAADWRAPVHRNAAEYAWLEVAASQFPQNAVKLFGRSTEQHGFAMEFVEGDDVYLWKTNLLNLVPGQGEAAKVADLLGQVHACSTQQNFDTAAFQNRDDFHALRIEPYLSFTAQKHPDLGSQIHELEGLLYESQSVLVHGDASPKNILFREGTPLILDAECATMGDASFDPAFCLNHLILKAIHLPSSRAQLLGDILAFWAAYKPHISWENPTNLEARICHLLAALMLARVDGKSPVEYLDEREQEIVRHVSIPLIQTPAKSLTEFVERVTNTLKLQANQ